MQFNCASLPRELAEAKLFGHTRGAFTGAAVARRGLFREADGGTLLIDEIGELDLLTQGKLLPVLQEREVRPLGEDHAQRVDVRIIATTNCDLGKQVETGRFRQDLYYRLNVINVVVPSLRERRSDIPLLVEHFLQRFSAKNNRGLQGFSRDAIELLSNYDWPGNIRELENTIERAVVLSRGDILAAEDLSQHITLGRKPDGEEPVEADAPVISIPIGTPLAEVERRVILETLHHTGGDKSAAARQLGIATRTIYRKLDQEESTRTA